jgi:uncharacterized protein (TIGR03435 family)
MVEAKGDSAADAKMATLTPKQQRAEQQHMMQGLLEDRFKLKAHWETREGDGYNLVVAKGGPKLGAGGSMPLTADEKKMFGERPPAPLRAVPDAHGVAFDGRGFDYIAHACTMTQLATYLSGNFQGIVTDKTGLTDKYDFVIKFKGNRERDREADDLDPVPPLDRALIEELGLKVEPVKAPIRMLVIDHIEKPTQN